MSYNQKLTVDVTVIIPAFNAEKTIEKAVQSVLNGTCVPKRILVYDDCSTDQTLKILQYLSDIIPCLEVVVGTQNRGAGHARNELFKLVTTRVVGLLDADDYWYPCKLEKQLNMMDHEQADIVTCGYDIFVNDKLVGRREPPQKITYKKMLFTNWIPTSMTIFQTRLLKNNEMPKIRLRQDYAFWLQILQNDKNLKCLSVKGSFGAYNRHLSNISRNKLKNVKLNYLMFRKTLEFNLLQSLIFTFANIFIRMVRR